MFKKSLIAMPTLLGAAVLAASQSAAAPRDDINWDIFLKLYPKAALEARQEGAVGFTVTLDNKGTVTRCEVTHTSGHPLLDEETCKLVTLNAQFTPDPALSPSQTKTHDGLIAWKLPGTATVLTQPKPIVATAAPEKVVCKRTLRTGTLASFERTCMTPTEWAKQSEQSKEVWGEVQGKKTTGGLPCGYTKDC